MRSILTQVSLGAVAIALAACSQPLDYDLRGNVGGFSTAEAVRDARATANRPAPDARGVISYPTYQVALARTDDTVADVAARVGVDSAALARFNGIPPDVKLRGGEVLALPRRVSEPAPGTPGAIDITLLAGAAIATAPDTTPGTAPVTTTALAPAPAPATERPDLGPEPIRHKVERGETAYTIARLYQVPVRSLADWNGLGPDFALREGQYLLIPVAAAIPPRRTEQPADVPPPGSGTPTPVPPSAASPLPDEDVEPLTTTRPVSEEVVADVGETTAAPRQSRMDLPVRGRIIRDYSKGRNEGLDIAAEPGSGVGAAAAGTVAAITEDSNGVPIIVVRHGPNLLTVYANVTDILVDKGDSVTRGQTLAKVRPGKDAYVHFEVREGFDSVDPTPYVN
ncbi:MAG: peptidoglycan DD-metalloendopeptidase family protein [Rhodobacteraceae bacterium]|nr:peptidoglycan DD-metalloendopeptidase family protein [Paracoccaceae bacterium]